MPTPQCQTVFYIYIKILKKKMEKQPIHHLFVHKSLQLFLHLIVTEHYLECQVLGVGMVRIVVLVMATNIY